MARPDSSLRVTATSSYVSSSDCAKSHGASRGGAEAAAAATASSLNRDGRYRAAGRVVPACLRRPRRSRVARLRVPRLRHRLEQLHVDVARRTLRHVGAAFWVAVSRADWIELEPLVSWVTDGGRLACPRIRLAYGPRAASRQDQRHIIQDIINGELDEDSRKTIRQSWCSWVGSRDKVVRADHSKLQ